MTDIKEVFSKPPGAWSESDVQQAVDCYRTAVRDGWIKTVDPKTGEPKKPARRRKAKVKVDPLQIDLEELIKEMGP